MPDNATVDYVLDGRGYGDTATVLMQHNFDPGALRPYIGKDGRAYIKTIGRDGKPKITFVANALATLRKDAWIELDRAAIMAARQRLRIISDLRSAGLVTNLRNGMGTIIYQYQTTSDMTPATVSMDGKHETDFDRVVHDIRGLPLPIISKDLEFTAREIATAMESGSPLETTNVESASRKVAEEAEKLVLGLTTFQYGTNALYGILNFPMRLTKTLTPPTGLNQDVIINEVLQMKDQMTAARQYGPWMIYNSTSWDQYMDADYSAAKGDNTLRDRMKKIDGIVDIRTLDFLPAKTMIMIQLTSDVIRLINGMELTTLRWDVMGGLIVRFKVMMILAPQLRADHYERTGLLVATHA